MNLSEYNQVKDLTYLDYCNYLQKKYGVGLSDYFTPSFSKNPKVSRTRDGLFAHHKMEDTMVLLSTPEIAKLCPFAWQTKENIVYCDYLEHLLLHVLICKYPSPHKVKNADVGIGGVIAFLVPELNDLYSGWNTTQAWRKTCHDKVRNEKDVYLSILKTFIDWETENDSSFDVTILCRSGNAPYGLWQEKKNKAIYSEIKALAPKKRKKREKTL
ncbi:hypothetical protein ACKX2L_05890 [Lachnospiraceae bacterium YH-ros2228]